jgi:RHS repeat-associated protein
LGAEYSNQAATNTGTSWMFTDMLGSVRAIASQSGSVVECYDYMPFGRILSASDNARNSGCHPIDPDTQLASRTPQKFTGKERDAETGLDYFGARYYSGAQGRFTSVDPSMLSAIMAIPQSWNRYAYTLNNPLRFVDPNGELWTESGNADDPYKWIDECPENTTCHETIAARIGNTLRIYGKLFQKTDIPIDPKTGLINAAWISQLGIEEANYISVQTPGLEEEYLGLDQAVALYNVAILYGDKFAEDDPLVFTGGSAENGGSALRNGKPIHKSHRNGANIDLKYMGANGSPTNAANGDIERNRFIIDQFGAQGANLGAALTGDPARYGLGPIPASLQSIHNSHMHLQSTYPKRPEAKITPGQR